MKIFRFKKSANSAALTESVPILSQWEHAKFISKQESTAEDLPLGWYCYKESDSAWYGLKPNESQTVLIRSTCVHDPRDLSQWLGIPLPPELQGELKKRPTLSEEIAAAKARMAARAEEAAMQDAQMQKEDAEDGKEARRTRPKETHIRFTEEEFNLLRDRVEASNLPQSVFMRQAVLTGQVKADPHREVLIGEIRDMNAELRRLRGDLGKLGGLLKMTIKPNEDQRTLSPDDWDSLIQTVHALFRAQNVVEKTMEKLNGNYSVFEQ